MSRTLGTNLEADIDAKVSSPRYLIQIDAVSTLRYATGGDASGQDISWGGHTWSQYNVRVSQLRWAAGGFVERFVVRFAIAPDLVSTFTSITPDTPIALYVTAALSSYAGSNDVVELFDGECNGGWALRDQVFELEVIRSGAFFPPYIARPNEGFSDLTKPGVYQIGGRTVTLERDYG